MKIIDLSMPICPGMTTYPRPWHPFVEVTQLGRHGIEGRETRKLVLGTHTGTHVDAPRHFIPGGASIDDIDLSAMNGPAIKVDLSHKANLSQVTSDELKEAIGGRNVRRVVLEYGWDSNLGSMNYYSSHPYLTLGAAQYLVDIGCTIVGMDSPMPDNPAVDGMPIHKRLLSQGVVILEYLVNLSETPEEFELVCAPLNIVGGDGAPARAFAIVR